MPLSTPDIAALSRLLDEALALDDSHREAWLAALPAHEQHLLPKLREMLAEHERTGTGGFLSAPPGLEALPDDSQAHAGDLVGPYRLLREIGHGGMGTVWLAERADGAFKRQVALKLPRLAWGAGLVRRMAREREIGAMLEHPNIARLYDAGVDDKGRPYLALEYIDGVAIDLWCQQRQLSVRDKLALVVQVAKAVAYAHGRLVVHRDLKPSNVLVSADGQVHLLDFGIAKLLDDAADAAPGMTQEHGRMMTPHYAAPEQLRGEVVTVQSDVYSLGVLTYELVSGSTPHRHKSKAALEEAVLRGDTAPPSSRAHDKLTAQQLKGDIDAIVGKAMKVDVAQRYTTAEALAIDVERYLRGQTVFARPDSAAYRLSKALRRHWVGMSASAAVVLALLGGAGVAAVQAQRAANAAEKERMVTAFVADVFRVDLPRPAAPGNVQTAPAEAFVERSAKLIKERFAQQPAMQAQLYAVVGKVFADMGAYRLAGEYARQRMDALAAARAGHLEQAHAALDAANALLEDNDFGAAEEQARRALSLAQGNTPVKLAAQVLIANAMTSRGQHEPAAAVLDSVEAGLKEQTNGGGVTAAQAMAVRGALLAHKVQRVQALALYDAAIERAMAVEGPDSYTAAKVRLLTAHELASTSDAARATQYFEPGIQAIRRRGQEHRVRAALETARFTHYRYVARMQVPIEQARASIKSARQEIVAAGRLVPSELAAELDFYDGSILSRWGATAEAMPLIERSAEVAYQTARTPMRRFTVAATAGWQFMMAGQHDLADHWLRRRMQARSEMGRSLHPFAAIDWRFVADNLRMARRLEAAELFLSTAPTFPPITLDPGAPPQTYNIALKTLASELALDQGKPDQALARFPRELPDSPGWPMRFEDEQILLGRIWCAGPRKREGLAELRSALSRLPDRTYEHHPDLAHKRSVAGLCAIQAGDKAAALGWARQARASFTAQPGVSDYYKAPLRELERKLGLKLPPLAASK